ncbi:MAG: ABC transporter permease [Acidobacteriota bacterium]
MRHLLQDLKFALRTIARNPWTAILVIFALALGIGANTAIFTVANGLFLQPLSFPDSQELVQLRQEESSGELNPALSEVAYGHWAGAGDVFESVAAYSFALQGYGLAADDRQMYVQGSRVTGSFEQVFGTSLARGRWFDAEEDRPGGPKAAVVSHGLWQSRWGGSEEILQQTLSLNGEPHRVIGVMSADFSYPQNADLWISLQIDPSSQDLSRYLMVTGRLADGVSLEQARSRLQPLSQQFNREFGLEEDLQLSLEPLSVFLYGDARPVVLLLLLAVSLVLLIACANVTNLQLVRSTTRRQEIAVRRSMGATRRRIAGQLVIESLVLSLFAAVGGVVVALLLLKVFFGLLSPGLTGNLPAVAMDSTVLLYSVGIALLTGLLSGLAPALQAGRGSLSTEIKEGSTISSSGAGWSSHRLQFLLVMSEVAVAVVLLVGATLLVRSFGELLSIDPGFEASGVASFKFIAPADRYGAGQPLETLERELRRQLEAEGSIETVALVNSLPMELGPSLTFIIPGLYQDGGSSGRGVAQWRSVSPSYFEALSIQLQRGRLLEDADRRGSAGVAVINRAAAERYFPNQDPVGERIHVGMPDMPALADPEPREIVGVVLDVKEDGLKQEAPPVIYVPITQAPDPLLGMLTDMGPLVLLTSGLERLQGVEDTVRQVMWQQDPDLLVIESRSLGHLVDQTLAPTRFQMLLITGLAGVSVALVAIGIYGILAYLVNRRRREIGVRMTLGGQARDIRGLVLRQGMRPVIAGSLLGLLAAFFSTRLMSHFVYGVTVKDPLSFVMVALLILAISWLAVYLPARRAARVDPIEVLRPRS